MSPSRHDGGILTGHNVLTGGVDTNLAVTSGRSVWLSGWNLLWPLFEKSYWIFQGNTHCTLSFLGFIGCAGEPLRDGLPEQEKGSWRQRALSHWLAVVMTAA